MTSSKRNNKKAKIYLKIVHIFLDALLIFIGVLAFLATIWVKVRFLIYEEYLEYYLDKPVLVLCLGFVCLIFIGWLGVISVVQNYLTGIITFTVLLFGQFMFTVTLVGFGATVLNFAAAATYETLEEHTNNYTSHQVSINLLQYDLSCCGINSSDEWITLLGYIPGSCCNSNSTCDSADVNLPGCYATLTNIMSNLIWLLCMVLIVLGVIKIVTIALSCFLIRIIQNANDDTTTDLLKTNTEIPRVQNSFAQTHEPEEEVQRSAKQNTITQNHQSQPNTYVRYSSRRPIILNYRSRHENYLSAPAQLRFDRRYISQHNAKSFEHPRNVYARER